MCPVKSLLILSPFYQFYFDAYSTFPFFQDKFKTILFEKYYRSIFSKLFLLTSISVN